MDILESAYVAINLTYFDNHDLTFTCLVNNHPGRFRS